MKKISILLGLLFAAFATFGQAKIASDGSVEPAGNFPALKDEHLKGSLRIVFDTIARNNIPAAFRKNGMFVQTTTPFTLWRLDSTTTPIWKAFNTGTTTTSLSWDSVIGKPSVFPTDWASVLNKPTNFSTNYSLSNDVADSIQARVIVKDNADYRIVTGTANVKELKAQSRLNFYPDSGIMVVSSAPGSGYGAEIDFDNTAANGTYWGFYGGSTSVTGMMLYRYQPTQVELAYWDIDRYTLKNDAKMSWSSTAYAFNAPDVAISREGASLLQINNGTTNTYADLKLRTLTSTDLIGTGTRMVVANSSGVLSTQSIPSSPVSSVFGRTGSVTAQTGDYSVSQITGLQAALDGKQNVLGFTPVPDTRTINGAPLSANIVISKGDIGLSFVPNVDATNPANISQSSSFRFVTDTEKSTWNAKQNALGYTPENAANKGIANGYADLDANGKVPASRIDFGQTGQTFVVESQSAMLALNNANVGALAVRTDQNRNYRLIAQPASTLANWIMLLSPDAPVQSVNGQTGNVNLLTTNISEGANLYYTDARARSALSAGTGISYNSITGAISSTITQYTDAMARASLSAGAGISYNSTTGQISFNNTAGYITGNQTITLSGDATGSGTTSIAVTLANSGVTAGTYTKVTVDAKGRVTVGASLASSDVTTALGFTPYNATNPNGYITATTNALTNYYTISQSDARYPLTNGTGASGTWGISISGNAATATTATNWSGSSSLGSYAYRSSGLAELGGSTFIGSVIFGSQFRSKNEAGFLLRNNDDNATLGGFVRESWWFGNTNNNPTIFAETGLGINLVVGGLINRGLFLASTGEAMFSSTIRATSTGVDGTYQDAFIAQYSANNNETNAIQTAVSSTASGSGFRFQASNGGGSSARTTVLTLVRDGATFNASVTAASFIRSGGTSSQFLKADGSVDATAYYPNSNPSGFITASALSGYLPLGGGTLTGSLTVSVNSGITVGANQRALIRQTTGGDAEIGAPAGGYLYLLNNGSNALSFGASNAATFSNSVTATSFFESSDLRLKEVFIERDSEDGMNAIFYRFKGKKQLRWGYSAQAVQKVLPYAVQEDSKGFLSVDYTTVHTYKIAQLEARIALLEKMIKK